MLQLPFNFKLDNVRLIPTVFSWYLSFDDRYMTRPKCALDMRTFLCLYVPGFQRQLFKHVKIFVETIKMNERTKEEQPKCHCCGIR